MRTSLTDALLTIDNSLFTSILVKVTLTTAMALIGTWLARRSRASVRHVLLAASFAVLVVLPIASAVLRPVSVAIPVAAQTGNVPLVLDTTANSDLSPLSAVNTVASSVATRPVHQSWTASSWLLLLAAWMIGATFFVVPVVASMGQIRSLRRSGLPWQPGQLMAGELAMEAGLHGCIDVLLHERVPGPMTCGVIRPAIMLPMDAATWPADELSRAIVHELEHVRRGDWLSRYIARAVCAIYWFHPLVWTAWRQFILEAERACDDAVLRRAEATSYADQLVLLAQRLLSEPRQTHLAMANRCDLARRVSAILDHKQRRGRAGGYCIGIVCAAAILLVATFSPLRIVARSQTPAIPAPSTQTFDVASVKPCLVEPDTGGARRAEFRVTPGRTTIECIPLARIIYFAYAGVGSLEHPLLNDSPSNPDHVRGGPGWIRDEKFTIEATAEGITDRTIMMGPMLRAVLAERFQLKTHRETEEVPMYGLTVAKGGLKMQPIEPGGCTSADTMADLSQQERMAVMQGPKPACGSFTSLGDGVNSKWILGGESLDKFANQTLSGILDRYVLNNTGVQGLFNIHLEFGLDDNIKAGAFGGRPTLAYSAENPPPAGIEKDPSIFSALEEQLGLKIEKTKGPREFLVIDSVARPSL